MGREEESRGQGLGNIWFPQFGVGRVEGRDIVLLILLVLFDVVL